jgi:hypothetical protein
LKKVEFNESNEDASQERKGLMWRKEDRQKQIGGSDAKPQYNAINVLNAKFSGK